MALTTGQVMFMVAEGYAAVTTAYSFLDDAGKWWSRPVKTHTTNKGLERR